MLSPHFSLDELTRTNTSLPNIPSDFDLARLRLLATALEEVRTALGHPVIIKSGFRSEMVNHAVGGSPTSAHRDGLAADFICPGFGSPHDICLAIIDAGIEFDQLILESSWVHFGLGYKPRHQVLTAVIPGRYAPGLTHV